MTRHYTRNRASIGGLYRFLPVTEPTNYDREIICHLLSAQLAFLNRLPAVLENWQLDTVFLSQLVSIGIAAECGSATPVVADELGNGHEYRVVVVDTCINLCSGLLLQEEERCLHADLGQE